MLYTKRGSIPQAQTDGTKGWIDAPDKPECPDGKEVVWLNWEWIIRDPKPENREDYVWKWNHEERQWAEYSIINSMTFEQKEEKETDTITFNSADDIIDVQSN